MFVQWRSAIAYVALHHGLGSLHWCSSSGGGGGAAAAAAALSALQQRPLCRCRGGVRADPISFACGLVHSSDCSDKLPPARGTTLASMGWFQPVWSLLDYMTGACCRPPCYRPRRQPSSAAAAAPGAHKRSSLAPSRRRRRRHTCLTARAALCRCRPAARYSRRLWISAVACCGLGSCRRRHAAKAAAAAASAQELTAEGRRRVCRDRDHPARRGAGPGHAGADGGRLHRGGPGPWRRYGGAAAPDCREAT